MARGMRRRIRYPTRAKIVAAVETARDLGIEVGGFEVFPGGAIRVFEARPALPPVQGDFDRYEGEL